jgi:uncharacterized protein YecE (DUF72 family)
VTAILIGSASWTDKTLIDCGRFYPADCRTADARLRYYASRFPVVEVDSSYYGMPTPQNAQLWAERTPAHFVFNVKAFRLLTGHQTSPDVLHRDLRQALGAGLPKMLYYKDVPAEIRGELWRRFIEALAPLKNAGKLGAVHFQFAPWVIRNRDGMAHVRHCAEMMQGHTMAVEFRNRIWLDQEHADKTIAFERELGVVHTIVDAPQGFTSSVPCAWEATHPRLALLRLHGRNKAAWNSKGSASSSRFDYWYSADELEAMIPEIQHIAAQVDAMHIVFNTNYQDQGQVNARLMRQVLGA